MGTVSLTSLWLPILVSAIGVFVGSFLMWMVLPHHKKDWGKVADEDGLMDTLRAQGVKAGQYAFPCAETSAQMNDPEFQKRYAAGPSGMMVIRPTGGFNMGTGLAKSFGFNLVISICVAYVASITLVPAASGMQIFRLTSVVAFLGYAGALGWGVIWWSRTWSSTIKEMLDGLFYGLITGAAFLLLWP
ncbi:MAG: hypothetical protein V3T86_11645 [Planctomycetota bacterium]